MKSALASIALAAGVLQQTTAHCPNFCNGHGRCVGPNECECFDKYEGGDCSIRKCPHGRSWFDVASGTNLAHEEAECSNMGTCNHETGVCTCQDGFEGIACSRMICPSDCSGHGKCRSMRFNAQIMPHGSPQFTYTSNWDSDMVFGCVCDTGYAGYDCQERLCATGDDPMTTGQADEVQLLRCDFDNTDAAGGSFILTFREESTAVIDPSDTLATLEQKVEALSTIGDVEVSFNSASGSWSTVCNEGASLVSENIVAITFKTQHGDVPHLTPRDADGADLAGAKATKITMAYDGAVMSRSGDSTTIASQSGSKEDAPCSGRGKCNSKTGICECYTGYLSSDGRGNTGDRGDCGHDSEPITSCPGVQVECSGNGLCSGHPEYKCTCNAGFTGGDCSERLCPVGAAWFDDPTANNQAHAPTECSNHGTCDRTTGKCRCRSGYEGVACERLSCPQSLGAGVCNGHGRCMKMAELANYAMSNGVATPYEYGTNPNDPNTWDWNKGYGCLCDEGWQGYDCIQRVCPTGDDVTTKGQTDEIQEVFCRRVTTTDPATDTTSFRLRFREAVTAPISWSASSAEVTAALEALETIGKLHVVAFDNTNTVDEACPTDNNVNKITVSFSSENGDLPIMTIEENDGFTQGSDIRFTSDVSSSVNVVAFAEVAQGTTEDAECSGRGICDHDTGECRCFPGFGDSDGSGGKGGRGDCGYREPFPYGKPGWEQR